MQYIEPVRRVDTTYRGKPTHHYEDANGQRIPGVTTILGDGWPKPALVGWGIKHTAEYAVNNREDITQRLERSSYVEEADYIKARDEMLREIKGAPYRERDRAANRGTEVHALAEKLVTGEPVSVPKELQKHVDHYIEFLDALDPEPLMTEVVVYNLALGYAGSLDLVGRLGKAEPKTWLMDLKTNQSGVFNETALQLAAYAGATHYIDADGVAQPMPQIDELGVIWVTDKGWQFKRVREDRDFLLRVFRHVSVVYRETQRKDGYFDGPMTEVPA